VVAPATSRLVVNQFCVWRPDNPVARCAQAKAKIDVVKCDGQIFIEPSDLHVGVPSHHGARSGNGGNILRQMCTSKITRLETPEAHERMAGNPTRPENHS